MTIFNQSTLNNVQINVSHNYYTLLYISTIYLA